VRRRRQDPPRRRYRRLTVRVLVEYGSEAGPQSDLATTLGAGGLFVATEAPLPPRSPLHLAFRLPGSERLWKLEGRVVWTCESGMGIEFLDRSAIAALARALEAWPAGGDGP